jgi:hypothetical protein
LISLEDLQDNINDFTMLSYIKAQNGDETNKLLNLSGYAEMQKNFFKIMNFSVGGRAEYYKLNDTITDWNPIFQNRGQP